MVGQSTWISPAGAFSFPFAPVSLSHVQRSPQAAAGEVSALPLPAAPLLVYKLLEGRDFVPTVSRTKSMFNKYFKKEFSTRLVGVCWVSESPDHLSGGGAWQRMLTSGAREKGGTESWESQQERPTLGRPWQGPSASSFALTVLMCLSSQDHC